MIKIERLILKKLVTFSIAILLGGYFAVVFGQKPSTGMDHESNLEAMSRGQVFGIFKVFDNRYEGVEGTPLLFDDMSESRILYKGLDTLGRQAKAMIDLYSNMLYISINGLDALEIAMNKADRVELYRDGDTTTYLIFPGTWDPDASGFYELLHEGTYTLAREIDVMLKKADYKGPYSTKTPTDEFVRQERLVLLQPNQSPLPIKLKHKWLCKNVPELETALESFKERKGNLKTEADLISVLSSLDK